MTDIETWLLDESETIFTISRYRKMFTPYEQENKFMDETKFEDDYQGKIKRAINLGYDILLEIDRYFQDYDGSMKYMEVVEYELLSNIHLTVYVDSDEETEE